MTDPKAVLEGLKFGLSHKQGAAVLVTFLFTSIGAVLLVMAFRRWNLGR